MSPLISLQAVTKSYTTRPLFDEISLVISEGERLALIGSNGSGKSTLLKIMAGLEHPDSGEVTPRRHLRVGYVAQNDTLPEDGTVGEILAEAAAADHRETQSLVARYIGIGGFLGRDQQVSSLSGGWKKRLCITRELIKEPELLLLDEPTNHLDIGSILWLEEVITNASFASLFVSHDRYFIEEVSQRVVELDRRFPKGFLSVPGSYSDFLMVRNDFLEQMQSYKESLSNKVRNEVEWLKRGARARTTKAKGRITEAHRLINELKGIDLRSDKARFEFTSTGRKSKELIKAEGISKSLGGRTLFRKLDFLLSPGTRLGVVGNNGSGKTTLLKTLLGQLKPDEGKVTQSWELRVVYFDQARQQLDKDQTLKAALCHDGDAVVFNNREVHVSSWAKRFLFNTDQLQQPIRNLSGGEQARVLVARLMLQPADVLILDEPTNDLDIPTLEVLEETLCEFEGAVILVTHDRFMLDRVSTSVVGLSGDGRATVFADYTQWEVMHEEEKNSPKAAPTKEDKASRAQKSAAAKKKLSYAERLDLEKIEHKILEAEKNVSSLQNGMNDPKIVADHLALQGHFNKLSTAEKDVERLYARWHELETKKKEQDEG